MKHEEAKRLLGRFWPGDVVAAPYVLGVRRQGAYTIQRHDPDEPGIYVGWRVVNEGHMTREDSGFDTWEEYQPRTWFMVAAVVFDPTKNPIYVRPADLRMVREGALRQEIHEC